MFFEVKAQNIVLILCHPVYPVYVKFIATLRPLIQQRIHVESDRNIKVEIPPAIACLLREF